MSNFCPHCGIAVTEKNSTNCLNCGKSLTETSETTKNDSINAAKGKLINFAKNVKDLSIKVSEDLRSEETKNKIKEITNQAQSFATEKTNNLKDEFNKINEARKSTINEAKYSETSKLENSKIIALSFWSKLTTKQKGILLITPILFSVLIGIVSENSELKSIGPVSDSSKKNIDYALKKAKMTRDELQEKVVKQLKDNVFYDPGSMQYKDGYFYYSVNRSNGHLLVGFCGSYNAKNKMGVYVPFQTFAYSIDVDESPMSKKLIDGGMCPMNY